MIAHYTKRALNSFLPHHRPKQRAPRDALRLLQALIERWTQRTCAAPDLGGDGEDGVERPGGALHEGLVGVVGGVEDGDEDVASGEESGLWTDGDKEEEGRKIRNKRTYDTAPAPQYLRQVPSRYRSAH